MPAARNPQPDREPDGLSEWHDFFETAVEDLCEVSGVGESKAMALVHAGYETKQVLRSADQSELAEIEGIGKALAARIKADVGDSPGEQRYITVEMPDGTEITQQYESVGDPTGRYEAIVSACGTWKETNGLADVSGVEEIAQEEAKVVDEGLIEHYGPTEPTPADDVYTYESGYTLDHGPGEETTVEFDGSDGFTRILDLGEMETVDGEELERLKELYPDLADNLGDDRFQGPLSEYVEETEGEAFAMAELCE